MPSREDTAPEKRPFQSVVAVVATTTKTRHFASGVKTGYWFALGI